MEMKIEVSGILQIFLPVTQFSITGLEHPRFKGFFVS